MWRVVAVLAVASMSLFGSSVAIEVNGTCEMGNCTTPDTVAANTTLTTNFDFTFTFADTDMYRIFGSFIATDTGGTGINSSSPFNVEYLGPNAASGTDVLTIDFFQNYAYTGSSTGSFTETLRGTFAGPIAGGSSVTGRFSFGGNVLPLQGPFSPPGAFLTTSSSIPVTGLTNPLLEDETRTYTFASGSLIGADVTNGTASPVPEPSALLPLSIVLLGLLIARAAGARSRSLAR